MSALKTIRSVLPAPPAHWVGDGFHVYPVFANKAFTAELSPFLMLDYAAPKHFKPTKRRLGVGKHPHRGFETVTIAFQGEVEHGDSLGNTGVIGTGDVQWMTAARGIVHEEFHSTTFAKKGGTFEMIQLWINLPKAKKMIPPRYQPILSEDIPVVKIPASCAADEKEKKDDAASAGHVRVIAGSYNGVKGPAHTFTPVQLWDMRLTKASESMSEFDFPKDHNVIVFVRKGALALGDGKDSVKEMGPQNIAYMQRGEGTKLMLRALQDNTQVMLLAGEPIDEPIAARGPFVMNTDKEIRQATNDYHSGKLGR